MKKLTIAMALLFMVAAQAAMQDAAMAQGRNSSSSGSSGGTAQAPIGHRQPRSGDVPNEKNLGNPNEPVNKEDALLDKKIKSICRGC